jgi:hypothetical protein
MIQKKTLMVKVKESLDATTKFLQNRITSAYNSTVEGLAGG